jgi:hypothetical protein
MTRLMRKNKKWLLVGFGILLMLAFLGGPLIQELQGMQRNRVVARIDGKPVRAIDMLTANREISAFAEIARRVPFFNVGIPDRDVTHWLLLTREAHAAGMVGEEENGEEYLDLLVPQIADQLIQYALQTGADPALRQRYFEILMEADPARRSAMEAELRGGLAASIRNATIDILRQAGLNSREIGVALARLAGVQQLRAAYVSAPRVSSRAAALHGKEILDAVSGDYLFIPALNIAGEIPDPTPEQLQAHFERFRTLRPGEGDYGIGYLLPQRIKLEYLKLDRQAIAAAIELDGVELRKMHAQNRTVYPGEFPAERPRVEETLRNEKATQVMAEAQAAVQREVQKATRRLETRQRYRVLPPDWEQQRPRLEAVALAVVDEVRSATGVEIPTPEVRVLTDSWHTRDDLLTLPGIGVGGMVQGSLQAAFPDVAFWAREFGGEPGFLPVQTGVPVVENYIRDAAQNRYFFTILAIRPESPPDNVAELGQQAIDDFKRIAAYEQARQQIDQLRLAATAEGLDQLAQTFNLQPTQPENAAPSAAVRQDVTVRRGGVQIAEPALQEETVRDAIVTAAGSLDPLTAPEQWPAEAATFITPAPRQLGVVVFRARRLEPMTIEMSQDPMLDNRLVSGLVGDELRAAEADPFSLEALLRRHNYVVGDRRIATLEDLRRGEQEG